MLNYMRALLDQFAPLSRHEDERAKIEGTRRRLTERLDKEERKLLLNLVDMKDALCQEMALESFVAGFKLACGIAEELRRDGLYSYDAEEQKKSCQMLRQELEQEQVQ